MAGNRTARWPGMGTDRRACGPRGVPGRPLCWPWLLLLAVQLAWCGCSVRLDGRPAPGAHPGATSVLEHAASTDTHGLATPGPETGKPHPPTGY